MGRKTTRPIIFVLVAALLAVTALAVNSIAGSTSADAQAVAPARLVVADQNVPGDSLIDVVVELDPGSSRLGAVTAGLRYDANELAMVSCEAGLTGVCNDLGGEVAFARLSIDGLVESIDAVTIQFERIGSSDTTELIPVVETAVDAIGEALDQVDLIAGVLSFVEASGALTGEVVDSATGQTLYDIDVCISSELIDTVCSTTTGLGTFRFDGLPSGTYTVVASDGSGVLGSATVDAVVTAPDATGGVLLSLDAAPVDDDDATGDDNADDAVDSGDPVAGAPGSISGTVVDAAGVPIFGLEVCAAQPLIGGEVCAYTTGTGSFTIEGLGSGNYGLSVNDPAQRYAAAGDLHYVGVTSGAGAAGLELVVDAR